MTTYTIAEYLSKVEESRKSIKRMFVEAAGAITLGRMNTEALAYGHSWYYSESLQAFVNRQFESVNELLRQGEPGGPLVVVSDDILRGSWGTTITADDMIHTPADNAKTVFGESPGDYTMQTGPEFGHVGTPAGSRRTVKVNI